MPASTYWTLDVDVPAASEELWSLFCYRHGATGAEWLEEHPDCLRIRYTFDALNPAAAAHWPDVFRGMHPDLVPPARVDCREHALQPWATQWREHFRPQAVGRRLLICPPWDDGAAPAGNAGRLRVVIDPGQGFGTGQHASTVLALELLEQALEEGPPPGRVLDVGTGSGILAIAACRLGARNALCIDLDGRVLPEVRRNFSLSALPTPPALIQGGPACVGAPFPLVLANLTAPVLLECGVDLARLTLPGGHLILSGILTTEFPAVEAAFCPLGTDPCPLDTDPRPLGLARAAILHRDSWTGLLLHRQTG
jgi:ribosomal protein L11 methyltransferase